MDGLGLDFSRYLLVVGATPSFAIIDFLKFILNFLEEKSLSIVNFLRFLSLLNVERKQALDRQKKREADIWGDLPTKRDGKNLSSCTFSFGLCHECPYNWVGGGVARLMTLKTMLLFF